MVSSTSHVILFHSPETCLDFYNKFDFAALRPIGQTPGLSPNFALSYKNRQVEGVRVGTRKFVQGFCRSDRL
ncbi:hypothetical protein L2E82_31040 [Cichorium intybus]|uniref:Uncharacterized protein n=1 Tax=Cichorium intybus TaxID=13427 RepID=A0ACB9D1U5_CICIN|nr:hypothetical protein L2E82_31040 [Cichorium intybus]